MIINKEKWDEFISKNKDACGKACIDVAREVMNLLDADDCPLHGGYYPDDQTPHGLICKADHTVKAGGITGFMAGVVAQMIVDYHSRGEEFRKIWNAPYNPNAKGVINPALMTIVVKE